MKKIIYATILIFGVVLFIKPNQPFENHEVHFNQFYIQQNEIATKSYTVQTLFDYVSSSLNLKSYKNKDFNYTNELETFEYLFNNLPRKAIVYPTETYYYFMFELPKINISGNLRFVDIDKGALYIGYFDKDNIHKKSYHKTLTQKEGVFIKKLSEYKYKITYKDKTVTFKLSDLATQPPKNLKTLSEEKFISQIHDESGIKLFLYFNNKTNSFYYILNEENKLTEKLVNYNKEYLFGSKTDFVYYYDKEYNRKILIGVSIINVNQNNYFDGPFDQVPPRLQIREKLYLAYPHLKEDGGIDQHGNFIKQNNARVAISPYNHYLKIRELVSYQKKCSNKEKSELWKCLVDTS